MNIRVKLTKIENKDTIERINETQSWFFENLNKIVLLYFKRKGKNKYILRMERI